MFFYDSISSVNCNSQQAPKIWEELIQLSPQLQREHQSESPPNLLERDNGHQIPITNFYGNDLPSSLSQDEQVESSEAPTLEEASLDTEPMRSS